MRVRAAALLVCFLVSPIACDRADSPPAEEQQLYTVRFKSAAEAHEARLKLETEGAEVSERIRFVDGAWSFASSRPYEPEPPTPVGECYSTGQGPLGPGSTACDLQSDAERERQAMVEDGWECSSVVQSEATGKWEFTWVKAPNS
jgi:hypothetical protein